MTDPEYVKERDKLIPFAVHYADSKWGARNPRKDNMSAEEWAKQWNLAYLGEMDRLARKEGITR
jgi:hypothetical protein